MVTIWKFTISTISQTVLMPRGAKILSVHAQHGEICAWAEVDTTAEQEARFFEIYGTGHPIKPNLSKRRFLGTVLLQDGALVLHVYEKHGT